MTTRLMVVVLAAMLGGCGWGVVDPGERGVFARFGEVENKCYPEGLYFYNPFSTTLYEIDAKVQAHTVKGAEAATRDLQTIHSDVVVNFAIDGTKCHELVKTVGTEFKARVLDPAVQESLKAATAHFPVEKVIQERAQLKAEIEGALRGRMTQYALIIKDVNLVNFGFDAKFTAAVVEKQVQEQRVQTAEYQRQEAVKLAEKRVADARGQAESNRLLAESLKQSPETLRFKELEVMAQKWNGQLPQTILGGSAIPMLKIGQ